MVPRKNNLITQAQLSKIAGVSTAAACKQCKGTLKDAWDGTYLDTSHPAVVKYLASKKPVAGKSKRKREEEPEYDMDPVAALPADIRALVDFPLRKILDMYGTDYRLLEFLKASKEMEVVHRTRLDNAAKEGVLVNRDMIRRSVLDPLEAAHVRMLQDGSKTIATRLSAMAEAGVSLQEREKFVHDQLSSFIKPLKARIKRALKQE